MLFTVRRERERLIAVLLLTIATGCGERSRPREKEKEKERSYEPACVAVRDAHPASGVTKVVLRATEAAAARVETAPGATEITLSGRACMQDSHGDASRPSRAGFAWKRFDGTLLGTTKGEFVYIHFGVTISDLVITVPPGVTVDREPMRLNGDMEPDLRPPGAPPRPEPRF